MAVIITDDDASNPRGCLPPHKWLTDLEIYECRRMPEKDFDEFMKEKDYSFKLTGERYIDITLFDYLAEHDITLNQWTYFDYLAHGSSTYLLFSNEADFLLARMIL